MANIVNLRRLGIDQDVKLLSVAPNDFRSVFTSISESAPDEIYNLSGQTSVGLSYVQPVECIESISDATLNLLETIKHLGRDIRLFNAGSSECFGETGLLPANEETPLQPKSPYAVAKSTAIWLSSAYREAYKIFTCSGILGNHESPLRAQRFVTQKIIQGVKDISDGKKQSLSLGNISVYRDWGWAPDYVRAIHLMLQQSEPNDFVIATGKTLALKDFIKYAFEIANLDMERYLLIDDSEKRPSDIECSALDPSKANQHLGWSSSISMPEIVRKMYCKELF